MDVIELIDGVYAGLFRDNTFKFGERDFRLMCQSNLVLHLNLFRAVY